MTKLITRLVTFTASCALSITTLYAASLTEAPSAPSTAISPAAGINVTFHPPSEADIPQDEFGDAIRLGRDIMLNTPKYAAAYVGNQLSCANCHLDAGRMAGSAPLWASFANYPAYRSKNKKINSYQQRLQGCFRFSMNGVAPPLGDPVLEALEAYSFWLATGLPINQPVAGRGYPEIEKPALTPDFKRGQAVYAAKCALCHATDGGGQQAEGRYIFPPLWGDQSYNWGAGMANIDNAARFIRANMPYGMSYSLSPQDAWDVAYFINAHERPQDPRWLGNVQATRAKFHDSAYSLYGQTINGKVLGDSGAPRRKPSAHEVQVAP